MENIKVFQLKIFNFYSRKNLCILHGQVFVMSTNRQNQLSLICTQEEMAVTNHHERHVE